MILFRTTPSRTALTFVPCLERPAAGETQFFGENGGFYVAGSETTN
jgi:hypothetical protein